MARALLEATPPHCLILPPDPLDNSLSLEDLSNSKTLNLSHLSSLAKLELLNNNDLLPDQLNLP